mmetsp:Transcript_7531/g.12138  ORF Transcript_7531/g.12138 Transcript_7531/m.12138 type:complete len:181 (-) Transcript_7531:1059-1601(-)
MNFAGQDWGEVSWDNTGKAVRGQSKKKVVQNALRSGNVVTEKKYGAGGNTQGANTSNAVKLEEDHDTFKNATVSLELKRALQKERQAAGITQKELATLCNVKATIIQDYESGKAIPNSGMLKKIENGIKQKNPEFKIGTFTKAQKRAIDKRNAAKKATAAKTTAAATAAKTGPVARSRRF